MRAALNFRQAIWLFGIAIALLVGIADANSNPPSPFGGKSSVLVVGSANADTFLPVARLPTEGENLTLLPGRVPVVDVPGGKGCTQAVAVAKLLRSSPASSSSSKCLFIGQLGLDPAGKILQSALEEHGVDCSHCGFHSDLPSGRGYVFFQANTGSVSAIVSGGSNALGWDEWEHTWEERKGRENQSNDGSNVIAAKSTDLEEKLENILEEESVRCVLLQREVPEFVNLLIASCVKDYNEKKMDDDPSGNERIVVYQDVGGEDRPISEQMLKLCDFIVPNQSEAKRLVESSPSMGNNVEEDAMQYASELQKMGSGNVLVTLGASGSLLVHQTDKIEEESGSVLGGSIFSPAIPCREGQVVDETGAGDCFRAAFAVAHTLEGCDLADAMRFANAAGSCSVQVQGAVPSTPDRKDIEERLKSENIAKEDEGDASSSSSPLVSSDILRGGGEKGFSVSLLRAKNTRRPAFVGRKGPSSDNIDNRGGILIRGGGSEESHSAAAFPFLIGSRLNSMKDRPDLWQDESLGSPRDYVKRQGTIRGLTCVDFNYPQHFGSSWASYEEAKEALQEEGLIAGAVCLRYPSKFVRGAMNHPDPALRKEAIELTKEAAEVATILGCDEVVIWSAFDGYDYPFQVDYDEKWDELVVAFQELCDSFPSIKFSLEYKPTDENTRFFTVPTTGAALLLVEEINRPNMGLTLDVGHMLMAGENPGQSIAMVGRKGKLFGVQLNDGFTRLAAEDGLMFGSVHPSMALETMYQLYKTNFRGHFYFDTFPQRTDPVKEAEYNIRQVKRFWRAASEGIDESLLRKINNEHDAVGALELVDAALWNEPTSQ